MAHVKFIDPVESISGKLSKKSKVTFMVRQAATSNAVMLENPNFTHIMGKRTTLPSASEVEHRTRFGQVCKATTARLKDSTKVQADLAAFKAQSEYRTLRQYVWHKCAEELG